jgi:hypothetical protein
MTMARVAQGFTRGHVLQAHAGGDVAGADFVDFQAVVGVHLHDPADALLLAADRVVDAVALGQHAGIDAHERQLAHERVGHQLERQRGELLAVVGLAGDGCSSSSMPLTGGMSTGRRHQFDHGVEHALHALVLEGGAAQHRLDLAGDGARAQAERDLFFGQVALFEVLVHQLFVGFGGGFDHLLAPFLGCSARSAGISS